MMKNKNFIIFYNLKILFLSASQFIVLKSFRYCFKKYNLSNSLENTKSLSSNASSIYIYHYNRSELYHLLNNLIYS